jgi:hypothetical protein
LSCNLYFTLPPLVRVGSSTDFNEPVGLSQPQEWLSLHAAPYLGDGCLFSYFVFGVRPLQAKISSLALWAGVQMIRGLWGGQATSPSPAFRAKCSEASGTDI